MKNFWDDLDRLHDKILAAIERPEGWKKLEALITERENLMRLIGELIQRGHLPPADVARVQRLREVQRQLVDKSQSALTEMKRANRAAESYESSSK